LVSIISFMYRYLFVLTDEVLRLLRARDSRSARMPKEKIQPGLRLKPGGTISWRAKTAGNMAGQLFLRSYERSDRIFNAMMARGYTGQLYTLNPHVLKMDDWLLGGLIVILLLIIQIIGWFGVRIG